MSERDEFEAWIRECEGHPFARQFANLMWKAWQAARAPQAVPEGWKLVPVEPTESMRLAPAKDRPGFSRNVAAEIYRAMLDAAPQPSQEPEKAPQRYQD